MSYAEDLEATMRSIKKVSGRWEEGYSEVRNGDTIEHIKEIIRDAFPEPGKELLQIVESLELGLMLNRVRDADELLKDLKDLREKHCSGWEKW